MFDLEGRITIMIIVVLSSDIFQLFPTFHNFWTRRSQAPQKSLQRLYHKQTPITLISNIYPPNP